MVTIPAGLPSSDKVYIAGDQVNGWNPSATPLTQIDATHWTYTQTYNAGSTIQYKYTLGSWDSVEVDSAGNDIGNRQITVTDQGGSKMSVNDTVQAWKSVP